MDQKAAAPLTRARPQEPVTNHIISNPCGSGKPNALRALRLSKGIPAKEMVDVVQTLYPKYDKTIQSKCENPEYGVHLNQDAMDALQQRFDPDGIIRRKSDRHRRTCRISCRLEDEVYAQLQQRIRDDGFPDVQSWLERLLTTYLRFSKTMDQIKDLV